MEGAILRQQAPACSRYRLYLSSGDMVRRPADIHAFIPLQAEPAQILHQLNFVFRFAALCVGVFNPQDKRASKMSGHKPIEQGRAALPTEKSGRLVQIAP